MKVNKILKFSVIMLLLLFTVGLVSAGNFTELQSDIDNAPGNNITLQDNYTWNTGENISGININKTNFVVEGNGYTIDGNNSARIFNITVDNVTIKNLKLINGKANHGGAIAVTGNYNITIINSNFAHNTASSYGGGGAINGIFMTVINSTFTNNTANQVGGAIMGTIVAITDSTFTHNTALMVVQSMQVL